MQPVDDGEVLTNSNFMHMYQLGAKCWSVALGPYSRLYIRVAHDS